MGWAKINRQRATKKERFGQGSGDAGRTRVITAACRAAPAA